MITVPCTVAQRRIADLMDLVARDREPVAITHKGKPVVVLLDAQEYASMESTLHLLSTTGNTDRLATGLAEYADGKIKTGNPSV